MTIKELKDQIIAILLENNIDSKISIEITTQDDFFATVFEQELFWRLSVVHASLYKNLDENCAKIANFFLETFPTEEALLQALKDRFAGIPAVEMTPKERVENWNKLQEK